MDVVKSGDKVVVVGVHQPYVRDRVGRKDFDAVLLAKGITPYRGNIGEKEGENAISEEERGGDCANRGPEGMCWRCWRRVWPRVCMDGRRRRKGFC